MSPECTPQLSARKSRNVGMRMRNCGKLVHSRKQHFATFASVGRNPRRAPGSDKYETTQTWTQRTDCLGDRSWLHGYVGFLLRTLRQRNASAEPARAPAWE